MTDLKARAAQEAARLERKYGLKSGAVGSENFKLNVVPTGSLALDYALGTGGWPLGHPVEVFGAPDIGKSSVIGFNAIANAQRQGLLCGIISLEPGFDEEWAYKNGVDPETVVVSRPNNGEEAFQVLYEWVRDDIVDFMVFDSVGAVQRASEIEGKKDSKDEGKQAAFGASGLITWGISRILMPAWKANKGVILLNQIRDDTKARMPGIVTSGGGHALKHSSAIRVHLKTQGMPYKARVEGEEVEIGRTLVAVIKRNKLSEGSNRRAEFDYYQMETDEHLVGIDTAKDVINTAIRTRVIEKAGGWFRHSTFPGEKHQFQGRDAVEDFLFDNPKAVEKIREEVILVMLKRQQEKKDTKPDLKVADGTAGE